MSDNVGQRQRVVILNRDLALTHVITFRRTVTTIVPVTITAANQLRTTAMTALSQITTTTLITAITMSNAAFSTISSSV